jgi:hypothetical protein
MTLMTDLHHFFLEMSKKCWPRFRVRNSTIGDTENWADVSFSCQNF